MGACYGDLAEVGPGPGNRFELQFPDQGFSALAEEGADEHAGELKWCNDALRLSANEGRRSPGIYTWCNLGCSGVWDGDLQGELVSKVSTSRGPTASNSFDAALYRTKARS